MSRNRANKSKYRFLCYQIMKMYQPEETEKCHEDSAMCTLVLDAFSRGMC